MTLSTQCLMCKHYTGFSTCDAFPEKIPQEIFDGTFDHTEGYPGDNGIRFESVSAKNVTKMIEIDITPLTKSKQRVAVKATATRKAHFRTQEVGQKDVEKKPPRKDTGKIASLPEDIKKEILDLRRLGDSGTSIKSQIENMIDASDDPKIKDNLAVKGILKSSSGPASLNVTGQSLVDWSKARGVESDKKRKTVKGVEEKAKVIEETRFKEANEKLARLQTENKMLQEQLGREKKSKMESDSIRDTLRNENYILREKLKSLEKPGKEGDNKKLVSQYLAGMEHASRHLK